MDINDIRKIFGTMPIEGLTAAQLLQKKKNRNILTAVIAFGSLIFGAYLMNEYHKFKNKDKGKIDFKS
jgi:uncharacterized membrane protein YebE (DUF533 family)